MSAPRPVTVISGEEELLVDRAIRALVAARAAGGPVDVTELAGREATVGALAEAVTPSLFGEPRVVVIRDAADVDAAVAGALAGYAAAPPEDVSLVIIHSGGARGRKLVDGLVASGAATVPCPRLTRPAERTHFVRAELRADGRPVSEAAVRALLDAVGSDLRELANASAQLLADTDGPIDGAAVARYHRGRAETSGFTIADRAIDGDATGALELLRWALALGTAPVLVTSALATGLRAIAQVAAAGRGNPAALAKALGLPPWKVERTQRQARGWTPPALAGAVQAVAAADAEVKGAGADPAYAVERAVLAVAAARRGEAPGRGRVG